MAPKISVIVPVYKAEEYLCRCVESILSQTFKEFELLLIDDGSPDKSGEICDEYARKDTRVRVFHKKNGGVSSARQCGIDNALGEYTIHADPDDWVEPNMLEELYANAKEEDSDMVICDFYIENIKSGVMKHVSQAPSNLNHDIVLKELFLHLHGSCWNKLIKRNCYKRYNIKFPCEFSLNEDLFVNMALLRNDIKISYLSCPYYHYLIGLNENSIVLSKCYSEKYYEQDIIKIEMFSEMMRNHMLKNWAEDRMIISMMNRLFDWGKLSSFQYSKRTLKFILSIFRYKFCPVSTKIKLLLSSIGLYRIVYNLLVFKRNMNV